MTVTDGPVPTASLTLPASEADAGAEGTTRTHACICQAGAPRPGCPVHAVADRLLHLRRQFPERFVAGIAATDLPIFPDAAGRPVGKKAFVRTIEHAAVLLDVPLKTLDGKFRISGHSLRPTGAQGLSRMGLDTWAIQMLGRWGSAAVLTYIRDAAASPEAAIGRRGVLSRAAATAESSTTRALTIEQIRAHVETQFAHLTAEHVPPLLAHLRAELLELVRPAPGLEACPVAPAAPPSPTSPTSSTSSSSGPSPPPSPPQAPPPAAQRAKEPQADLSGIRGEVSSGWTRTRHIVNVGPHVCADRQAWATACGWRFCSTGGARAPLPSDLPCRRCWPA